MITAREFLNVVAILESIDEVPGMPAGPDAEIDRPGARFLHVALRNSQFRDRPLHFLRRADDATRDAIWAEVERRIGRGENAPALAQKE